MSKEGGIAAFCVPCFLFCFVTMSLGMMAFVAEGEQVGQFWTMSEPVTPSFAVNTPSSPQNPKHLKRIPPAAPSIKAVGQFSTMSEPVTPSFAVNKPSIPQNPKHLKRTPPAAPESKR